MQIMSAKKKAEPTATSKAAPEGEKPVKKGNGKLLIGAFISAVVICETAVFFFLVPSGEEVAALAESRLIEVAEQKGLTKKDGEDEGMKIVEFDLDSLSAPFTPQGSDRNHRVEMRLFGTVYQKDEKRLVELFKERKGRFKHRLNLELRSSTLEELQENQLGLIQRRILATSNELLGEPILLSVGFHDYQVIEE
jgi:hypothetical protein